MAASRLAVCLVVLMLAVSLTEGLRGSGPKRCCFNFNEDQVPSARVVGYVRTSQRCPNRAILLKMVTGRSLCVRPSSIWVKRLVSSLDAKSITGQTSNL